MDFRFCLNNWVHCLKGGTCSPFSSRFLFDWLNIFLSKVKGMNDQGIMRNFHLCALVSPKFEI